MAHHCSNGNMVCSSVGGKAVVKSRKLEAFIAVDYTYWPHSHCLDVFVRVFFCFECSQSGKNIYSQHDLLKIGVCYGESITSEFIRLHNILEEVARSPGSPWITIPTARQCRERRIRRGCRGGELARLQRQPHIPPLSSLQYFSRMPAPS